MNGFSYNELEKKIWIKDETITFVWINVQKNIAEKAAEMFGKTECIGTFLIDNNCKRFWGYK